MMLSISEQELKEIDQQIKEANKDIYIEYNKYL